MFTVGSNIHYYAVDHSPSLLWNFATWEISQALLPHLRPCLAALACGTPIRPFGGPSRSALASSRTRTSCPFSTAQHNIRIRGSSNATTRGPEHPSLLICSENIE